ncbi:pentapeptide repeat domain-containing protein [Planomonospora sphaerica]|uniref:Pentapeptide repeat domain-containing protein n=2 Tax=Planomonospora sphaerica TaxID=161355 RepID=A0A161LZC7_9ACTN|nr:pentapeptide repeat domain-containing protein [Planomonospora sphaerica]
MRRSPSPAPVPAAAAPPHLRPPRPAGWWIVPVALGIGAVVFGVAWWLLTSASAPSGGGPAATPAPASTAAPLPSGVTLVQVRSEVLRTALAAGAGIGAAITLMLAFRRQRHQEIAIFHTSHDATERRVTDLYTKAVEQLGHGKAAVRLGGLYALERLAQDNPGHRQTIVNVICAYLRMPYTLPAPASGPVQDPPARPAPTLNDRWLHPPTPGNEETPLPEQPAADKTDDAEGERQVRLTAQRILGEHLRDDRTPEERDSGQPADVRFWPGMRLDLTGATLIDLDFQHCHMAKAQFSGAVFTGDARFDGAVFTGDARFIGATFTRRALFDGATFTGDARFIGATFTGGALFDGATFTGDAGFVGATFAEGFQGRDVRVLRPDRFHRGRSVRRGDFHRGRRVRRGDLR